MRWNHLDNNPRKSPRTRKNDSRVPLPKRLVDAERSASVYVRPREDALIAVGGVTALPAAPNDKVIGLCGLWSNGALGPETFRSCPPLPGWVRPIAAQAVSAALWATSRDNDWRKPARAASSRGPSTTRLGNSRRRARRMSRLLGQRGRWTGSRLTRGSKTRGS
jgi:hypothetical protein